MKKTSISGQLIMLFCILSCQSSLKIDCEGLNWRAMGETLASKGVPPTEHLKKLTLKCKKLSTEAETANFNEGYQRGLAKLCTTQNGYDFGASGESYQGTCPDFRKSHFLRGFYKGRLEFLDSSLEKIEELYNSSEERVWRKEREYTIIQSQDPERAKLEADVLESYREEARSLANQAVTLKREILETKKLSAESFF